MAAKQAAAAPSAGRQSTATCVRHRAARSSGGRAGGIGATSCLAPRPCRCGGASRHRVSRRASGGSSRRHRARGVMGKRRGAQPGRGSRRRRGCRRRAPPLPPRAGTRRRPARLAPREAMGEEVPRRHGEGRGQRQLRPRPPGTTRGRRRGRGRCRLRSWRTRCCRPAGRLPGKNRRRRGVRD